MNRKVYGKLIFELSREGRRGYAVPRSGVSAKDIHDNFPLPEGMRRAIPLSLPEVDEPTAVRHYNNMSTNNFGVDTGFYPLGSCTMKYNPKINEEMASHSCFAGLHPSTPAFAAQGALEMYWTLQKSLCEIGGMEEFTLNPFAGAQGELTGLMVIRAYHASHGEGDKRRKVIVPDSAHGTNPASAAVCGLEVVEVKSREDGTVDVADLEPLLDDTVAAMMLTNPNTLGIFEKDIPRIASLVHQAGALMYYDGANLNPLLGVARPGDMGFDVMHVNLHKTFSTPHGGGGPGAGPVGVRKGLEKFLPNPRVVRRTVTPEGFPVKETDRYAIEYSPLSLGSVSATLGNFAVQARALAYILTLGSDGLMEAGKLATLNATYIKESLKDCYLLPIEGLSKHEFVFDGLRDKSTGVTTLNIAKRLLDHGYHAPTIYFPLLFHESLMIEPTETESRETLDEFISAMRDIAREAIEDPETVKTAPHLTPVTRPDDTAAALNPILTFDNL